MSEAEEEAVLVATLHRGIFLGVVAQRDDAGRTVTLTHARNVLEWTGALGFLGLASRGPLDADHIGPAVTSLYLTDVTAIAVMSADAWDATKAWR